VRINHSAVEPGPEMAPLTEVCADHPIAPTEAIQQAL
jgi:hypothetical protein